MSEPSPVVVKFGGELIEQPSSLATVVSTIAAATATEPDLSLVLVHGGGRENDAALKAAGIEEQQVEGLRITDEATLDVVVEVLAGLVNTRLVAALTAAGVRAVGLTGADDGAGLRPWRRRMSPWMAGQLRRRLAAARATEFPLQRGTPNEASASRSRWGSRGARLLVVAVWVNAPAAA